MKKGIIKNLETGNQYGLLVCGLVVVLLDAP